MFGCFFYGVLSRFVFYNLLSCCFKTTGRQITVQYNRTHLVERQQLLQRNRIHAAVVDKSEECRLATFLLLRTRSRLQHTHVHAHIHTNTQSLTIMHTHVYKYSVLKNKCTHKHTLSLIQMQKYSCRHEYSWLHMPMRMKIDNFYLRP